MTTVNSIRRADRGDNENTLIINLNQGNNWSYQNILTPSIRNQKICRILANTQVFVNLNFIRTNNYLYDANTPGKDLVTSHSTFVGEKQMYYYCYDNISRIRVALTNFGNGNNTENFNGTVQLFVEFLEDMHPDLCLYTPILRGKNVYMVYLNSSNNFTFNSDSTRYQVCPAIQNQKVVRFYSNGNVYVKFNFIRSAQYYSDSTSADGMNFDKIVWVGEQEQYYLVDSSVTSVQATAQLPLNSTLQMEYEICCEFLDFVPDYLLEDRDAGLMVAPDTSSNFEALVLYWDTLNNKLNLRDIYYTLMQKYSKKDAYFLYKGFKIYLSIFPKATLNLFLSKYVNRQVLTIRFVRQNVLAKSQFYTQGTSQIPNVDVYWLPFNWISSDITYSDNAGLSRGANNGYFRVFSCGYSVVTFCRGLDAPDIFSNPQPVQLQGQTTGTIYPYKPEPNGQPLNSLVDANFLVQLPANFRSLVIYPLNTPIALQYVLFTNQMLNTASWSNNQIVGIVPRPVKFFQMDSLYEIQGYRTVPTGSTGRFRVQLNPSITVPFTYIDTILSTTKPIIGNGSVVTFDTRQTFQTPYFAEQIVPGDLDVAGNVVPSTTSYILFISLDVATAQTRYRFVGTTPPTHFGIWIYNAITVAPQFIGVAPYVNNSTTYGFLAFIWRGFTSPPKQEMGGENIFYATPQTVLIHQGLMYSANDTHVPQFENIFEDVLETYIPGTTYGIDQSNDWSLAVDILHNFERVDTRQGGIFKPSTTMAAYNSSASSFNGYDDTYFSWFDDTPLSQAIKILPEGFQFRNYYQIRHLVKNTLTFTNLTWTQSIDEGTVWKSNPITLNMVQFGQFEYITGRIVANLETNLVYLGLLDNVTLAVNVVQNNDYGQRLIVYSQNETEQQFIVHQLKDLSYFYFTIHNPSVPDVAANIHLYMLS